MLQNKKNINLIFGHCCCFNHPIHLVSTIIEMQQHLNKVNNRIHVKITCRVFDPSLNNKTTVTYVMMQTTQKDSFFEMIDSLMKYMGVWKAFSGTLTRPNSQLEMMFKFPYLALTCLNSHYLAQTRPLSPLQKWTPILIPHPSYAQGNFTINPQRADTKKWGFQKF